jgi:hypothetical protein
MTIDKTDIITKTLEHQIERFKAIADVAGKEMHEHSGARDALDLLAKQMPGFATSIEERIEKDTNLSGETARQVLVYSKNIIARFLAICESNAQAQNQQRFIAQGRMETALTMIESFKKDIIKEQAFAARREELAEENRRARQPDNEKPETPTEEPPKRKKPGPKPGRGKAAGKKRGAKKGAPVQDKLPLDGNGKTGETDTEPNGDNS